MKPTKYTATLITLALLLAGAAWAQQATTPVPASPPPVNPAPNVRADAGAGVSSNMGVNSSATGVAGSVTNGAVGANSNFGTAPGTPNSVNAGANANGVSGSGSAGVNSATGATTNPSITPPTGTAGVPSVSANRDALGNPIPGQTQTGAQTQAGANGGINDSRMSGAGTAGVSSGLGLGISANLDPTWTVRAINSGNFTTREQIASQIDARMVASDQAMSSLKKQARSRGDSAADDFKAAEKDVEIRERQLKRSLKAARNATADTWEETRSAVASDYGAYAEAVARAEAAARGSASPNTAIDTTMPDRRE